MKTLVRIAVGSFTYWLAYDLLSQHINNFAAFYFAIIAGFVSILMVDDAFSLWEGIKDMWHENRR